VTGPDDDAGPSASGRRAVLMIFGGIALAFAIAAYLGTHLRAETRERLAPPAASSAP
jgi:hypothetical protein